MGTMAIAALADDHGMDTYAPADSSVSGQPEQGVELSDAGGIREPIETGALPDESERVVGHDGWVNMDVAEQNSSPELRGLSNIQEGGGGD